MELTWLGHGGWSIKTDRHCILLDPFLTECPTATIAADSIPADFILVSHGHFDHVADVPSIARRTGATIITNYEIAEWMKKQHALDTAIGMNIGGGMDVDFGHVKMTRAHHSSQLPDGSYGGEPAGFILTIEKKRIYFACDTGLFRDMEWMGAPEGKPGLDLAVLPIGDLFTMGPDDSIQAIKWLQPVQVAPAHYGTWPPIAQDVDAWAARVRAETQAQPLTPQPGDSFVLQP